MKKQEWKKKLATVRVNRLVPRSMVRKVAYMGTISLILIIAMSIMVIAIQKSTKRNFSLTLGIMEANESMDQDYFLNLQYLDSFDTGLLEEMRENMIVARESLENVKVSGAYKNDVDAIIQNINQYSDNMKQIISNNAELSAEGSGVRKQLNDVSAQLEGEVSNMNSVASWADLGMDSVSVMEHSVEVVDGKEYIKAVYHGTMPDCGRRDRFLVRVGAVGVDYAANVYLTEVAFSKGDVTEIINFKDNMQGIFDYSYGNRLVGVTEVEFAGKNAIAANCNFAAATQSWDEVAIAIPTSQFNVEDYDSVSYTVYFENWDQVQWIAMGASLDGKYDFYGAYSTILSNTQSYNAYVAYGNEEEAANMYDVILSDIAVFLENTGIYVSKNEPQTAGKQLMQQYQELLTELKTKNDQSVSMNYENEQLKTGIKTSLAELEASIMDDVNKSATRSIVIVSVFSLVAVAIITGLGAWIILGIKKNMNNFSDILQQVGEGNLKVRAEDKGQDEFAKFGSILNHFLEQLSGTLGAVQKVSKELNVKNNEISDAIKLVVQGSDHLESDEQQKGILQLQRMFEEIGSSVANQSASTEESLASLYEILEASRHAVEEINETTEVSENSLKLVQEGAAEVVVLTDKMDGIAKSVEQASEEIMELIDDSKKIEQVLEAIENLASQTNLLSLNASIEASRAGEEGRGFAVVANEVKKLSGETTNETQKISEIINSINTKIRQVQKANEQVIAHVQETHKITEQFSAVIQNMNDSTVLSAECIANLRNRMNDQMASTEQIVKAVDQISVDAQDIQNKTMETGEISKNLSNMLVENLEHVEEITEHGNKMEESIQFFEI